MVSGAIMSIVPPAAPETPRLGLLPMAAFAAFAAQDGFSRGPAGEGNTPRAVASGPDLGTGGVRQRRAADPFAPAQERRGR